jgi:hypothetical protein
MQRLGRFAPISKKKVYISGTAKKSVPTTEHHKVKHVPPNLVFRLSDAYELIRRNAQKS